MTINCRGKLLDLSKPIVMGVLNVTPDSFSDGGKYTETEKALVQAEKMLREGATIIDIGGMSSRPNAKNISSEEEINRVLPIVEKLAARFPEIVISIDTIYAQTADISLKNGASIINDISGGDFDKKMLEVVAKHRAPFVIMHMRGTPEIMQSLTDYDNVTKEVFNDLCEKQARCMLSGITDVIIDVGFGFAKTTEQNFQLLKQLSVFKTLDAPILAGLSRKSMITKTLNIKAAEALNGTSVLNTVALLNGANILRVHDVKEAVEAVRLTEELKK